MHSICNRPRYSGLSGILMLVSCFLFSPWGYIGGILCAFYVKSTASHSLVRRLFEKWFLGPVLAVFVVLWAPLGILGFFVRVFVCIFFTVEKYTYTVFEEKLINPTTRNVTVASSNLLLGNELFCRLNNVSGPLRRSKVIAKHLLQQSAGPILRNLLIPRPKKEDLVITDLPDVDVLCLQGVWERCWGAKLIDYLRSKYNHFVHDVGDFRLKSNFCLFGSGLFVASKYPIEAVQFQSFQNRIHYAKFFSLGVLCLKVRLGSHRAGYVFNLHCQTYHGNQTTLHHQMMETLATVNAFRNKTLDSAADRIVFDVICGDFNFDNMSPIDRLMQNHPLFNQYVDICSKRPGEDQEWTVGTKLRQQRMHETAINSPDRFRRILINDVQRPTYILDANIQKHSPSFNNMDSPPNDDEGNDWAGKRRTDRILLRKDSPARIIGYAFSTVLSGLTDHIPVIATLEIPGPQTQ